MINVMRLQIQRLELLLLSHHIPEGWPHACQASFHHLYLCPCEQFSLASPGAALTWNAARLYDLPLGSVRKQDKAAACSKIPKCVQPVMCDRGLQA